MRMMMPVQITTTLSARRVIPLNGASDYLSFAVSNEKSIEFVKSSTSRDLADMPLFPIEYDGAAILTDEISAFYWRPDKLMRLWDKDARHLASWNSDCANDAGKGGVCSVHRHVTTITAGVQWGQNVVSGDELGFVNLWSV
jgi:hypothetical protein